eukprot:m.49855 g.49855  ORF g.49855 m.49855 type:complete len:65 (+) comp15342_c0_seq7:3414-3608(+)
MCCEYNPSARHCARAHVGLEDAYAPANISVRFDDGRALNDDTNTPKQNNPKTMLLLRTDEKENE